MKLDQIRREYLKGGLRRADLNDSPFRQFEIWMDQACQIEMPDPTAMVLATVAKNGQPSQRTVLLKQFNDSGFVFYTNLGSRKAQEIHQNPRVSLLFAWLPLERQVIIQGEAKKLTTAENLKYFLSRPKNSQLAAWASHQSHPVSSRQLLEAQFARMKQKFSEGEVPLPDFWGGYRVVPQEIEFWQGGGNRLHDRFLYSLLVDGTWQAQRLAP